MSLGTDLLLLLLAIVAALMVGLLIGRRRPIEPKRQSADDRGTIGTNDVKRVHLVEQALDDLRLGVVVFNGDGEELYRNREGLQFATARHSEALVEAALERVVAAARIGLSTEEEVRLYGPPARTLLVRASPTETGEVTGMVATIEDVTEARHLDRVRSDFVANVSHELRTPVGAMSVLAETLAETGDADIRERLAGRIQSEAGRLADTVEDLLILSRLESGRDQLDETFDLMSVATTAVDRTAESSAQRAVAVVVDAKLEGPILVDGHFGQLVSAVANLVENGTKYSAAGSTVTLVLDVESGDEGPVGELSVIDEGIGIPESDLARIFERFYRVDTARSRSTGGTGLGLAIVRNAVHNHGGTVTVESTEGRGSRFTMRVPVSAAQLQLAPIDVDDLFVDQERNRRG